MWWKIFLNSNFFTGVITLFVGGFAIYLYIKQRVDKKRDAARLILQEIRYAEQQIRNSGRGERGYSLASKLLPTNSWNDNIHLFTKDLKETEIDMIGGFYSKSTYIDFLIAERSRQKLNQKFETRRPDGTPLVSQSEFETVQFVQENSFNQPLPEKITEIVLIPNPNENVATKLLNDISGQVEFIYNTPVVEKLRNIAEKKWYHLF